MKIAVVGGIGTGKSTIMQMFDKLGGITIYTDKLNKELLEDKEYIALIKDTFDNIVIDNKIDKKALRNLIVNNEKARLQLNAIAHPRIINKINELTTGNGLYFVEIPLFNEISNLVEFDKICAVKGSVALCVAIAVALSCAFEFVPLLQRVPSGFTVILCAVAASAVMAVLAPIPEEVTA